MRSGLVSRTAQVDMIFEVVFDLETQKFFDDTGTTDPADLGVSIVCLYRRTLDENYDEKSGEMLSFWEDELENMWKHFLEADRIVGFNSLNFDVPALKPYSPAGFSKLPHFDILDKIKEVQGRRVSLNALAKDTLGQSKTDAGANAIMYWRKKDKESLDKLKSYCEADVALTRDLYDFGRNNKYLKYTDHWNNPRSVDVDFSHNLIENKKTQTALF
jgi:DEAD/DEAH box helicase domain-containing protein